jgi:hypothetical protein
VRVQERKLYGKAVRLLEQAPTHIARQLLS